MGVLKWKLIELNYFGEVEVVNALIWQLRHIIWVVLVIWNGIAMCVSPVRLCNKTRVYRPYHTFCSKTLYCQKTFFSKGKIDRGKPTKYWLSRKNCIWKYDIFVWIQINIKHPTCETVNCLHLCVIEKIQILQIYSNGHCSIYCTYMITLQTNSSDFVHFISFIIAQGTKNKQLQNETDIKNANMFKVGFPYAKLWTFVFTDYQ